MGMADHDFPRRYHFDDLTLDSGQCRVWRAGRVVPLSKLTFDLLRILVERAPNVVSHDECASRAWGPRRIVTPENLAQRIMMLRQALGDDAAKPRYVEGVRGEGYRLVPGVRIETETAPQQQMLEQSRRRPWRLVAVASAIVLVTGVIAAMVWPDRRVQPPVFTPLTFDGGLKNDLQLAPNGDMVAFSWDGTNHDNRDIYVKQIGRDTSVIRITDDPAQDVEPVWSPDGRRLAFIRVTDDRSAIYIVPSLGGGANKVIDIEGHAWHINHRVPTLAWSPDGRFMVYAEKPTQGGPARLIRLTMDSLAKTVLTSPALNADALGDFQPSISPDGESVAYVRGESQYANLNVWLVDAEGGAETRITNQQWEFCERLSWLRSGRELLLTAGNLFEQRVFALRVHDGTLSAVPGLGENDRWAVAQGGRLAFARITQGGLRIWEVPGASAEKRDERARDTGLAGSKVMFSPDGRMIAWQSGSPQVWIAERDGTHARPITDQKTPAFDPQWAPDGKSVAFESHDAGNADVYVVEISSGRVRRLTSDPSEDRWPTYSRDGRYIYFSSHRGGTARIYRMPANGGDAVAVSQTTGFHATESEDGQFLYFAREEDSSIWRKASNGVETRLFAVPDWNRGWTLASRGVYYLSPTEQGFALRYRDLTSGTDVELHRDRGRAYYLTLSRDEQHVLFSREDRLTSNLFIVDHLSLQ
jgi:Tol biopolymer transport system component/DNA-binding winged helix-turn-helix (wHTH) protein